MTSPPGSRPDEIAQAVRLLASGGLVAFPTETVYGLGGGRGRPGAVARVFKVKDAPPGIR